MLVVGIVVASVGIYRHFSGPRRAEEALRALGGRAFGSRLGVEGGVTFERMALADEDVEQIVRLLNSGYLPRRILSFESSARLSDGAIASLAELKNLEVLCLSGRQISDSGLPHLGRIQGLWEVVLEGTSVTDAGLLQLHRIRELRKLALVDADVGDAGIVHLVALPRLESLSLIDCDVTDAGMEHLAECRRLRQLGVVRTRVTADGVRSFRSRRPHCQLTWRPK